MSNVSLSVLRKFDSNDGHDELADFLVGRQLLQRLLDPALGGAIERERIARRGVQDD